MTVYWLIFFLFAFGVLIELRRPPEARRQRPMWIFGGLLIFVMIGFRYEVGGDWISYGFIFDYARSHTLAGALSVGDPGYQLLNWLVGNYFGGEIVWVNVVCAAIFTWGLFRLARLQPDPWLAVLVAIPYMVIVFSSYTRQAAALGVLMAGLGALGRGGSLWRFIVYAAVAASFHRTSIAVLPLVIFARPQSGLVGIAAGLFSAVMLYNAFLADSVEMFLKNYIESQYNSQGASIRIVMSVLAAAIFLARRRDFALPREEDLLWRNFSLASLAALAALVLVPSSTAVDRLSLYLLPLQMVILARVPFVYVERRFGTLLVVAYCAAVQFVWLNYAEHARLWVPYQFYPLFD